MRVGFRMDGEWISGAVRPRPIDPPARRRYGRPDQLLRRCAAHVVVERRRPFVEAACVPRIPKSETLEIQMMAELVAQRAQERSERGHFLAHGSPHPHADQHGIRVIVAEEFRSAVAADSQRSRGEHANVARGNVVEIGCSTKKLCARAAEVRRLVRLHSTLDGFRYQGEGAACRQVQRSHPIAGNERGPILFPRWSVCNHRPKCRIFACRRVFVQTVCTCGRRACNLRQIGPESCM